ncbi:MAG: hypothetical protein RLZZ08_843 [Pseudomonadota bacterium]
MGLSDRFAGQLAAPRGRVGQLLGAAMDVANARVVRHAIDLLQPQVAETVLDAGCGTGAALAQVRQACPTCRLVGVDRSDVMIAAARRKLGAAASLHVAEIEQLPVEPGTVDAALVLNVLYFCGQDGAMVRALHRALRPGGRLVAYITHRETMERWPFAHAGFHRLHDAAGLHRLLVQGGFAAENVAVLDRQMAQGIKGLFATAIA